MKAVFVSQWVARWKRSIKRYCSMRRMSPRETGAPAEGGYVFFNGVVVIRCQRVRCPRQKFIDLVDCEYNRVHVAVGCEPVSVNAAKLTPR